MSIDDVPTTMSLPLVLASASPRRREILGFLGVPFTIEPADVDETPVPGETPEEMVVRLALTKARAVAARHDKGLVIGSDTTVALEDRVFGKPVDEEDARAMLGALQGVTHRVVTGLAVVRASDGAERTLAVPALVTMRPLDAAEIAAYVATGEPLDKAGAYGAQGQGGMLIKKIDGPYLAVVGLPIDDLLPLLHELGWTPAK